MTSVHHLQLKSVLCLPLNAPPDIQGALYLDDRRRMDAFSQADVSMLSAFGDQAAIALSNARLVQQLQFQATQLEQSRKQIEEFNSKLQLLNWCNSNIILSCLVLLQSVSRFGID